MNLIFPFKGESRDTISYFHLQPLLSEISEKLRALDTWTKGTQSDIKEIMHKRYPFSIG